MAFVTLALVLGKVAWKPLLQAGLDARQSHIEQQLKSAEDSRQRAEKMLDDYSQQGQNYDSAGHAKRPSATTSRPSNRPARKILALRRRAQEEIDSARAAAMEELWRQTGEIVLRVGSEVLGRALSPQDNQRLIDEAVTRIKHDGGL